MTIHSMNSMSGQAVVALDNAEQIGKVKHFVVAPDAGRIERLHIDGRKKKALFTEWDEIESFGPDRVMVRSSDAPTESSDDRDIDAAKGNVELIGSRILDTAGFEHGVVADASFDGDTGAITGVTSSDGTVTAAAAIHSLGSYALILDA